MDGMVVVLGHAAGGMPNHDQVMMIMPIVPLLLIGAVVLANALDARGAFRGHEPVVGLGVPLTAIAAGLSLAAAAIHFAVIESHFDEFALYGYAFIGLAWFQAIWAQVYLLRGGRRLAILGAAVNAGVVVVWLISRTVGLPFGPEAGVPQPIGFADMVATSFEVLLVGVLAVSTAPALARALAVRELPIQKAFVLATFSIGTMVALTVVALATGHAEAVAGL